MNILINLLPPAERKAKLPLAKLLVAIAAFTLLTLGGLYAFGQYTAWQLERQIHDTRNQYELLRPTREKMNTAIGKQQLIDQKNNQLVALTKERKSWYAVLTHLGTVTPPQVWLTELQLADRNTVRMKGMASTYPDMAKFMETFNNDDMMGEPVLLSAEQDAALRTTRFEMIVKLKGL